MTRTNELTRSCITLLEAKGFYCWRSNNVPVSVIENGKRTFRKFNGKKGVSDILAVACGRKSDNGLHGAGVIWCVEIKNKDKQSEDQKEFQRQIEKRGGFYVLVRSTTDELLKRLKEEGY